MAQALLAGRCCARRGTACAPRRRRRCGTSPRSPNKAGGPAPPLDTLDTLILKPSAFGRGGDPGDSVHGGAEGRDGDAPLLPKWLITTGRRQKNRFNEFKEWGCASANNHTCPDLGFQLPILIAVAGLVAATKGPKALGRAGRSMFQYSIGPIDHLGLLSSRITTALGS